MLEDSQADAITQAVAHIEEWMSARGWVLDGENRSESPLSWVYPPSACVEDADQDREPVTRIWITLAEDDDEVVLEFGAALVGADGNDDVYILDPDTLPDDIAVLESYRPGYARLELH